MPHHFVIPRRFHPTHSALGRWIRGRTADARRAEALYILVVTALAFAVLLVHYLGWALLQPAIVAAPAGPVALGFWAAQLGMVLVFGLTSVVGFQPAITIEATATALSLQQGDRRRTLRYETIRAVSAITDRLFYQHYARYAATEVWANRLPETLLLIRTDDGPLVLGLDAEAQALLHTLLACHQPTGVAQPTPPAATLVTSRP